MPRILSLGVFLVIVVPVSASDWPQWLGPHRNDSSTEKVAPWKAAPKVVWKKAAGEGHSSPVVADGRVFIHATIPGKNEEEVVAFDAGSGKELWRTKYERAAFTSLFGNGPQATPCVHDGKIYTYGITGILSCLEAASGKIVWQKDALKLFKAANLPFGMACSPIVDEGHVIVMVGGKGASIVAFKIGNGDVAWKALSDKASYASPIVFGKDKDRQVVFFTGQNLVSLQPSGGKLFWEYPLADRLFESSSTPVKVGDRLLASSITVGSVGLRLEKKDGQPIALEAWKNPALTSYFTTPVAIGPEPREFVFMVASSSPFALKPQATLHCVDTKSGKSVWSKADIGKYHAALMRLGDGRVLLLNDHGSLALLEPDTKEYKELCRSKICGEVWAHPALSDGKLYVRDEKELICLQME